MSLSEMARLANSSGLEKNDAQWWPTWMEAYARSSHQVDALRIDISRERLISLLRRMRDSGKSAWVRLQVVRAVEFYQTRVLQSSVPDLRDVGLTLEELARTVTHPARIFRETVARQMRIMSKCCSLN